MNLKKRGLFDNVLLGLLITAGLLLLFNQAQVYALSSMADSLVSASSGSMIRLAGSSQQGYKTDMSSIDISQVTSTAMAVATVFPELNGISDENDVINIMLSSGAPEYSELLGGITFDDIAQSKTYLARTYPGIKQELEQNSQLWQRYINLAAAPHGISCEFCCGVGPQGITQDGNLRCGCAHNVALQSLTMSLMKYTDYSDADILREVMRWKASFFPRDMVSLAMQVAGSDPSQLKSLPGMVGGC